MSKKYVMLIFSLAICYLTAFIGLLFTIPSIATWYAYLQKPFFNPPNWIFGPVWSLLFTMMGYALFLVIGGKPSIRKKTAIIYFALQLILNTLWSIVFFGLHFPGIAFIIIMCLWISILLTIRQFLKIASTAGYLMIPYLCWVSFASILNAAIVLLN